jgi:DNA-binding response OmpR family regulator
MGRVALKRVLVVEDELLIAMDVEEMLRDMGMEIVGPAGSLEAALELARTEYLDCAVLDVNLGDGTPITPLIDVLSGRGIPFVFITGYSSWGSSPLPSDCLKLTKPFTPEELRGVVRTILH